MYLQWQEIYAGYILQIISTQCLPNMYHMYLQWQEIYAGYILQIISTQLSEFKFIWLSGLLKCCVGDQILHLREPHDTTVFMGILTPWAQWLIVQI